MNLPKTIVPYLTGILSAPKRYTATFLATLVNVSHDTLTRSLKKEYDWKGVLSGLLSSIDLSSGYLIIDETDIDHSYAKKLESAVWIFSHRFKRHIFGYYLIVLAWTNGTVTIPLVWKIYDADTNRRKITKLTLAKELFSYAIDKLHSKPRAVLFDSYYASGDILSWLDGKGIAFVSQVKKNRKLNGKRVDSFSGAYWTKQGYLQNHIPGQIVKNRKKYFITNNLTLPRNEQLEWYHLRWRIEEVFRFTKQECGLESCQATTEKIQQNHFGVCFLIYALLQAAHQKTGDSLYAMKLKASSDLAYAQSLLNSALFAYA